MKRNLTGRVIPAALALALAAAPVNAFAATKAESRTKTDLYPSREMSTMTRR